MKRTNKKKGTVKKAKKAPKGFVSMKVDYAFVSVMKNLLVLKGRSMKICSNGAASLVQKVRKTE